jgi:[acyl-carrier-protein] S-malonyltransferase
MVFPGQGSQAVGMLSGLAAAFGQVEETFQQASDVLGYDLWKLVTAGPEEALNSTDRTQPAMLAAGVAVWRVWQAGQGVQPSILAGHSLGEYTALVCANAMVFDDAIRLVADRGRLMQAAVPAGAGGMAAILGLDDAAVETVCSQAAEDQVLSAVNFNSPGQVVIAGTAAAVERALAVAKEAGARQVLPLPVSVPSHCALMQPAAEKLAEQLAGTVINTPEIPVIHNVDAATHAEPDEIRDCLQRQLYSPVQWVKTVNEMSSRGVTRIIEAGPGKVLAGLCKRIDKTINADAVFDPVSLSAALEK